jgi:glutamate dehydrogenase (NAD(P)+)
MARAFAFLMQGGVEISDAAIFSDASTTIAQALERCHARSSQRTAIASTAFEIALQQLV